MEALQISEKIAAHALGKDRRRPIVFARHLLRLGEQAPETTTSIDVAGSHIILPIPRPRERDVLQDSRRPIAAGRRLPRRSCAGAGEQPLRK